MIYTVQCLDHVVRKLLGVVNFPPARVWFKKFWGKLLAAFLGGAVAVQDLVKTELLQGLGFCVEMQRLAALLGSGAISQLPCGPDPDGSW